jgi:hypothetical protein
MKNLFLIGTVGLLLTGCHYLETDRTVAAPQPVIAAPAGSVSLHLATFREPGQEHDAWFRVTRDYPEVGQYPPRLVAVPYLPFSRLYELYVDGVPGERAVGLCADMLRHQDYCAILAQSLPAIPADFVPPPAPGAASPPPVDKAPL